MNKYLSMKTLFIRILLLLPFIYIGFGWYVGLNYGRKAVLFGPYPDIPWVFSYWFGRIGFHEPNLIMSNDGWQVILWSFWHGFIQKEGRLFLVIAIGGSLVFFGAAGLVHIIRCIFKKNEKLEIFKGNLKYANAEP